MFVCGKCGEVTSTLALKRAANGKAWAIGEQRSNGFHVRRIVWGLLMAQAEKRIDEEIREVTLLVERDHKKRAAERPLPEFRKRNPDEEVPL